MDFAAIIGAALASILSGAAAGMVASSKTIAALTVHIEYMKSNLERHDREIDKVHRRIDVLNPADCRYPELDRRNNGAGH